MSGPYQGRDLSNCGVGRLRVAINCGVLSVRGKTYLIGVEYMEACNHSTFSQSILKCLGDAGIGFN